MMVTMSITKPLAAALTALVMLAPALTASATVPYNEGRLVIGDPWGGPARTLDVGVSTGCTLVDGAPGLPTLSVTTRDAAWERLMDDTFHVSSSIPFVRTTTEVSWHNRDTGERGTGTEYGINGAVLGAERWDVGLGLVDVDVTVTQSPGIPVEFSSVRSHSASGSYSVTSSGCGV